MTLAGKARFAGIIYVVMSLAGGYSLLGFPGRFVVRGDAEATARRIMDGLQLYRYTVLGTFVADILFVMLALVLYDLFKDVNRGQARLLVAFVAMSAMLSFVDLFVLAAPPIILGNEAWFTGFTHAQLSDLALGALSLRSRGIWLETMFWGLWLIPFGILIIESRMIPKVIGYLLFVAAAGYIVGSIVTLAWPAYAESVTRYTFLLQQCELPVLLWLPIMGARTPASV